MVLDFMVKCRLKNTFATLPHLRFHVNLLSSFFSCSVDQQQDLFLLQASIPTIGYRYHNTIVLLWHFLLNYITKPLAAGANSVNPNLEM